MLHVRNSLIPTPPHPNTQECISILEKHGFEFECRFSKNGLLAVARWRYLAGSRLHLENGEWIPIRGAELYIASERPGEFLLYSRHLTKDERYFEQEAGTAELIQFRKKKVAKLIA